MKLVICFFLIHLANGQYNNTRFLEQVSAFLTQLCPRSNICRANDSAVEGANDSAVEGANDSAVEGANDSAVEGANDSAVEEANQSDSMFRSCCTDCSCQHGCEDAGDCCFASNAQQNDYQYAGFSSSESTVKPHRQCMYPLTGESERANPLRIRSYFMIVSGNASNKDCGNQKVAPWGNFYPVFSKRTGSIYKNEVCATVNNVTDAIFWNANLVCKISNPDTVIGNDITNLFADLEQGNISKFCHIQFGYAGDFNDIKSQVCYRDLIKECTSTEFQVPSYLSATKEEISDACQSGLLSPYYAEQLYANVFCYICSGLDFYAEKTCAQLPDHTKTPVETVEFGALLNPYSILKTMHVSMEQMFMACPKDKLEHGCRLVLCPSGKVRNAMGRCVFPAKVWYQQHYTVAIELSSEREINLEDTLKLTKDKLYVNDIEALYMSSTVELNSWLVNQLYYKRTGFNYDMTTSSLVVIMNRYFASVNPAYITSNIELLSGTNWFLKCKNETLILKPSLFKLKLQNYVNGILTPGSFTVNSTFSVKSPDYKRIYNTNKMLENGIFVTKLQFCEQIQLNSGEYILSDDQTILYNKISHQYLFDGEFSVLYGRSEGSVRICYENSGFVKTNVANCVWANMQLITAFVLLFVIRLPT